MARIDRRGFLAIAVVFHLIYVYSIFDIYFVSPIVSGMREYHVDAPEAPAQRLVLFVGDGLRADKAFQSFPDPSPAEDDSPEEAQRLRPLAPFIRSRVAEHGTFGVSHTRVPTESRPGHVALIAGLYEDVSAVLTGWKLNPVNFDSVFNRSRHTWAWGSPDILPMFEQGAVPGRMEGNTYSAEVEDFSQDAVELDIWVFDRVKKLFEDAKSNATLDRQLRQDKNVFFLHLLGLDTTGHSYRPYSKEYLHNLKVVDKGVQEITELIEEFYGDGKTAFVFTADHGMSDWGSHGDGHPDNTRTPLVVWGSGVAKPNVTTKGIAPGHEDGFSSDWGLDHIQRHDVAQADIAALMSYLAGLDFPVNSVGELPLSYIDGDIKTKSEALLVNAKEIVEMYRVKEEQKRAKEIRYKPYSGFSGEGRAVEDQLQLIQTSIDSGKFEDAIKQSNDLIKHALQGLRYLQTYDWLFLRTIVTAGYLGWIAFAITTVVDMHVLHGETAISRTTASNTVFSSILVVLYSVLFVQHSSWRYYAYAAFPILFWEEVFARRAALLRAKDILLQHNTSWQDWCVSIGKMVAYLGVLEALVQSYFNREIYTVCYLLAIAWPAFYGREFLRQNKVLVATWTFECILMSTFTLLPVVKVESVNQILLGGALMFLLGALYLLFEKSILIDTHSSDKLASPSNDSVSRAVLGGQLGLIILAMIVTKSSATSLQAKQGLPFGNQVVGWLVLVASLIVPFLHALQPNSNYIHRLVVIFLAFSPAFIILTISYEGLFYFAFCTTLFTWVRMEYHIHTFVLSGKSTPQENLNPLETVVGTSTHSKNTHSTTQYRSLTFSDARISLFFLFLLESAFFSTGNIASISSFSLDAVTRLIPVFEPFSQTALVLFKILVPFAVISANLGILNKRLGVPPSALFMVVIAIGDVMTLNFFYMVRDEGSWLEIGTTISQFSIASGLCVFVALLEFASEIMVSGVDVGSGKLTGENGAAHAKTANGKKIS